MPVNDRNSATTFGPELMPGPLTATDEPTPHVVTATEGQQ